MTIKEFLNFAKDCKTKPELASLAKSNGIDLKKDELNKLFQKITDGIELSFDELVETLMEWMNRLNKKSLTKVKSTRTIPRGC